MRAAFRQGWREDRPILISLAVIWAIFIALLATQGVNGLRPSSYLNNFIIYAATIVFFLVPAFLFPLFRAKPASPIAYLKELAHKHRLRTRFMYGLPMLLALITFMPAFSAMKSAIPLFNDFAWDGAFIEADRALHGGDPWKLLQPLFGYPVVTAALALAYHAWVMLIYAGGLYFCYFVSDRHLRWQYFIAFFGIWIVIGVVMATSLASVGPCFLGPLLGDGRFDEQMDYLYYANTQVPILTLGVQEQLVYWHFSQSHGLARGITAMPSMHVALAFLFFLAIRKVSATLGWVFGIFCLVILIGSVHLAYHYAVDGYVSIIVTGIIWWGASKLAGRMEARELRHTGLSGT